MAALIGVVSQVVGEVYAVAGDGTRRLLTEGDRVFAGEQLVTGAAGAVAVSLQNGQVLTLGRDSSLALNEQLLAGNDTRTPDEASAPTAPTEQQLTDVEKLQAAIEAGVDPTQAAEATAAGPGSGGGAGNAGGGHSFVLLDAVGGSVDPVIGFPTSPLGSAPEFPNPDPVAAADAIPAPADVPNSTPEIEIISEGGSAQSFEAALATGSNAAGTGEFTSGSFRLSDADGLDDLQSVTLNGVTVALGSLAGSVFAGANGTLTITAYNALTGVASYSYELTRPTVDGPLLETDSFSLSVSDGTASSTPTSIVIEIIDDVANAEDDSHSIAEGTLAAISGNVLGNDLHGNGQPGADSPTSFVAWNSSAASFGTFTNTGNGTYSYVLNNANPAVQALDSGERLTETFSYTMQDADGDLDTATLTLTITGSNDGPQVSVDPGNEGGNQQVFEAGLATGSNAAGTGEFTSGSFRLSDADGLDDLQSVTLNGVTVALGSLAGSVFAGANGTLTITAYNALTGVASYSYELTRPTTDGAGIETDSFSLSVSDGTASSTPTSIVIEIIDDVANAEDDSHSIAEGTLAAISGNVLGNDLHGNGQPGADSPTSFVAWNSSAASFGTFTNTGNGTYSYVLNNANPAVQALDSGERLTETFSYTMQDADGDLDTATLTLTITGSNDGPQVSVDPGNEGGNQQVFEAGLATGSNAAGTGEFTSGSFRLSDADGLDDLQSVTLNGVTVALGSLAGSVFAGANGTLTITAYNALTGVASYSYELTRPTTDGAGIETDSFSLSVSDGTASSTPTSIVIEIIDDVANAEDDSHSIAEGTLAAISGNVLGNDLHGNGQPGADSPTSFVAWNSSAASFGTFTNTGNGTYSYVLNNANPAVQALDSGERLTETFSYTMQDADGDLDTATLTLTITGSNDGPQVSVDPGNEGGNQQVFEAGLATGSNAAGTGEFTSGSFRLSDADGLDDLQSVTLNGVTVALGSLAGSVFAGANGTLTITAYNALTGVASYSYELTRPTTDGAGIETDSFSLSVSDGTASSTPTSIVIEIIDDVANAEDDSHSIAEGTLAAISGNVLGNDLHGNGQPGADSPTSFVAWNSSAASFGTFTNTGNGTYSYVLNNANPAVQALDSGERLTETFSYTMQDADGDLDTATLTLTITGSNDGPQVSVDPGNEGGNQQVFEAGLATGSNAAGTGEFTSGSFRLSDADGLDDLQSVTLNGVTVALGSLAGSVFAGANGTLTITAYNALTGVASYSYELTRPTTDGAGIETDSFSLSVSDGTASSTPTSIVIEIIDDVANAEDDSHSIAEGTLAAISGNVLGNDLHGNGQPGADSPTSFVAWNSSAASFGTFTNTGNGTYSYVLNNANPAVQALDSGERLTETFSYTMQDADGDLDTATLTLTITGSNDGPQVSVDPGNEGGNQQVFEAGLATGSNAAGTGEFTSGSFRLSDADGLDDLQSVTLNGVTVALGSLAGSVFAGANGTLTITAYNALTGVASYSYELTRPTVDGPLLETDSFSLSVSDGTASSTPTSIVIEIIDDVANAEDDSHSIAEGTLAAISGNVLGNDLHGNGQPGADSPTSFVAWNSSAASFGTFTNTGNGTYSYVLNNANPAVQALDSGERLTETFSYTMQDADGDLDTATLTLTITGSNDGPQVSVDPGNEGGNQQVFEAGLATGSNAAGTGEFTSGSFRLSDADGLDDLQSVTLNGVTVALGSLAGSVFAGANGTLTITAYNALTGVASYSYELTRPTVDGPLLETDSFSLSVSDGTASSTPTSIVIEIIDDLPDAMDDGNAMFASETNPILNGNVLDNDVQGADRLPGGPIQPAVLQGTYGTLTLNDDGSYDYQLDPTDADFLALGGGGSTTETFSYTLDDADGDSDTADLVLQIRNKDDDVQIKDLDVKGGEQSVDEDDLLNGSDPSKESTTVSGTFKVEGPDGLLNLTVHGISVITNGVVNTFPQSVTTPLGNILTITGYDADDGDEGIVSYSYTLLDNAQHAPGANENLVSEHFEVVLEDVDHDTEIASLDINIIDDVPTAHTDSDSVTEGGVVSGNVLTDGLGDVFGADGPTASGGVVGVKAGNDTATPASGSLGLALAGSFGTLTLHANGSYTYDGAPNVVLPLGATDVFTYTIQDGDGDLSTTTLTINLSDSGLVAPADNDALVYENALDTDVDGNDLAAGTVTGSLPGSNGETDASNQLNASGGIGTLSYAVVGSGVGAFGTIEIHSNGSYVYTLTSPVSSNPTSADGANTEDNRDSFSYTVTDANGNTSTGTITVDIVDDLPTAVDDMAASVAEDAIASIGGNVLSNDTQGADGATLTSVSIGGSSVAVAAIGTTTVATVNGVYTFTAAGVWTFDPATGLNNAAGLSADFSYTLTDGDGDTDTAVQPITVTDGAGPVAGVPITLTVDDQNLADGSTPAGADSIAGSITFTGGADAITSIVFGSTAGLGGGLTWTRESDTQIVGKDGGVTIVTLNLGVAGAVATVTATLANNYDRHPGLDVDDLQALGSVGVIATDTDGDTATGTVTVQVSDDVPTAMADTDSVTEDLDTTATGNVVVASDSYGADGGTVVGVKAGLDVANPVTTGVNTVINGVYGTLLLNAGGSYTYTLNNNSLAVQQLNLGSNVSDEFTYTISDGDGDQATTTLIIDVNGINDLMQGEFAKEVWMPADVAQMTNPYEQGYPLQIKVPTDSDGALSLTITELPLSGQIGYYDATNAFLPINLGVLDVSLIGDLIYIPEAGAADGDFLFKFTVDSSDGERVDGNFVIHTVPANSEPAQEVVIGDGKTPLTSGNDQNKDIQLSQQFVNGLTNNLAAATLVLFTDYQRAPFDIPISVGERDIGTEAGQHRETEVSVSITVDGIEFSVLEADPAGSIDQDWFFDPATGLMRAEVGFSQVVQVANPSVSLDDYLLAHPAEAGDTWTLTYFDNDGGSFQARYVKGEFFYNSPGDPGIMVVGDPGVPNLIFGTTSGDSLTGGNVDDVINGRDGNDQLYGLGGNDQIAGGAGLDFLVGGHGDDLLTGGDGKDTYAWNSGDTGVDHITDFFIDGPGAPGGNSDALDLSQVLAGEAASGNVLDDYLSFTFATTSTTIDVRATPGGAVMQQVVMDGVDLSDGAYYGSTNAATVIDGMLSDNALKVDTV